MAAGSAAARTILMFRVADLSLKPKFLPPLTRHLLIRHLHPAAQKKRSSVSCLISGFDGSGVPEEFVSTRKSGFGKEFSVIANMLKRIEPLDNSAISKGISDSAKDSMKQTISTMLGLLPSDQFSVTVRVSKDPLSRIIDSSIVTGYTLWNAEYRMSLMRNFDMSPNSPRSDFEEKNGATGVRWEDCGRGKKGVGDELERCLEEVEAMSLQNFHDLSPEALKYIQRLESELSAAKQELQSQTEENIEMEKIKKNDNNLLEYLRSLEPDMVSELSRPSSPEVEEIINELSRSILQRFFKDENASDCEGGDFDLSSLQSDETGFETCDTISTSRDYLAKLLFWCMLLGHHLRGLENRLHLSCAVGLL